MKDQHLSDEAVAAFADGVLRGHARERAQRHTTLCPECAYAVAVQREAVWALRAAPAPALPTALLERLREVPLTTPIQSVETALADDGSAMFASFGVSTMAAFVPTTAPVTTSRSWHLRPLVITTAAVAAASVLTVSSASAAGQIRTNEPVSQQVVSRDARTAVPAP
jgi:hypothetical protein